MLPLEGLLRLRARADGLQTCHQRHQRLLGTLGCISRLRLSLSSQHTQAETSWPPVQLSGPQGPRCCTARVNAAGWAGGLTSIPTPDMARSLHSIDRRVRVARLPLRRPTTSKSHDPRATFTAMQARYQIWNVAAEKALKARKGGGCRGAWPS